MALAILRRAYPRRRALREQVYARDRGLCAVCGLDCDALLMAYLAARADGHDMNAVRGTRLVNDRLRALGFDPYRPFWECDHAVAIGEGGTDSAENCQTLCLPCHQRKTGEHACRRARRRPRRTAKERRGLCAGSGRAPHKRMGVSTCPERACGWVLREGARKTPPHKAPAP